MPSQQVLHEKIEKVEKITQLIEKHKIIGMASLQKVRAAQLQEFKRKLSDKAYMQVIKNTLMKMAIENCKEKPGLKKLLEHLEGSNIYIFTDLNPFKLALILKRGKIKTTAKSGDIAAFDVIVPSGNTGQPPGPIISHLNAVGLPTRIESGSVWISKDTLVVRKGETIPERLASVLTKLGIKPVEAGLIMNLALEDGMIISQEQLDIDVDRTKKDIAGAHADSFALSLSIGYPTKDNVMTLLYIAHHKAYTLSMNAVIPTRETVKDLVRKAHSEMTGLSSIIKHKD